MKELLESIYKDNAIIITAPPGWGKTYKLLEVISKSQRQFMFIFPLRALCDEVHISAQKMRIKTLNIRTFKDYELVKKAKFNLLSATPELICEAELKDFVFIIDECHLFYYWNSFRPKMMSVLMEIMSESPPVILLTATLSEDVKKSLVETLSFNYQHIYHLNIANQKLKNHPSQIFYYPSFIRKWCFFEFLINKKKGTSLIFCKYRSEVYSLEAELKKNNYSVISCVGGEAKEFIEKLYKSTHFDFIVATSVVSHGVNLPQIRRIYFTYKVDNLDFYLQMIGRGGRDGASFGLYTMNSDYFKKSRIFLGLLRAMLRILKILPYAVLYDL